MLKEQASSEDSSTTPDECAGCGIKIQDRFYLLAVDRQWHGSCLRCCECRLPLDSELTCFSRDGNIYCKEDYYRLFCVKRCSRCGNGITANELVMRARDLVYHLTCFTCYACGALLSKGDVFGIRDGMVYCRPHYDGLGFEDYGDEEMNSVFRYQELHNEGEPPYFGSSAPKGRPRKRKVTQCVDEMQVQTIRMASTSIDLLHQGDLSSSMESLAYDSSVASPGSIIGHNQRTKRMRTSFKHHQLRTMKSYFAINQNPDAKDLKQLSQKTGLSKRVLQVWFQNARAKWRRNVMRQDTNQHGPLSQNGTHDLTNSTILGSATLAPNQIMMTDSLQSMEELRVLPPAAPHLGFSEIY